MMKDLSPGKVEDLFQRFDSNTLTEEDRGTVRVMMEGFVLLQNALKEKTGAIANLLKMIFGAPTEKAHTVLDMPKTASGLLGIASLRTMRLTGMLTRPPKIIPKTR